MSKNEKIDPLELHKLLKNKPGLLNFRMNPGLKKILENTIAKDELYIKRTDWFESQLIKYVMDKGGFDHLKK